MLKIQSHLALDDALYTIGNYGNKVNDVTNYEMRIDLEQIFSALQSPISMCQTSING